MGIPIFSVFSTKSHFRTWISDSLWRIKSGYFPHLPFFHKAGNSLPQMSLHCWKYSLWFGWGNYLDWACRRQDTWHPLTSKAADHEQNNDHLLISLKDMQLFHVKNTCFYCMFPWTLKYNSNEKKRKKKGGRRGGHRFVLKGSWLVGVFHRKSPIARANADPCQPVSTVGADEGEHSLRQQWAWVPWGEKSDNKLKPS